MGESGRESVCGRERGSGRAWERVCGRECGRESVWENEIVGECGRTLGREFVGDRWRESVVEHGRKSVGERKRAWESEGRARVWKR